MIFSKKIYKLAPGKNLTLYKESDGKLSVFVFNKIVSKYSVILSPQYTSTLEVDAIAYNQVTKINESHSLVCYDKNLSIINNDEYNL